MTTSTGINRVLLCALNAKYIHSSLSIRYLSAYIQSSKVGLPVTIKEFTINESIQSIMAEIYRLQPDVLGLSCYIWNIKIILEICADFKRVSPQTIIILGGPEVSYDAEQVLIDNACIDIIVRGEGEQSLQELLMALHEGHTLDKVKGISYRIEEEIHRNPERDLIANLDEVPFPYLDNLDELMDRIVYYESSRGCPFRCSYCLSSTTKSIRYLSIDRVKSDLALMLRHNVREIKFVDRTFNCDEHRAREIMNFIIEHRTNVKIHFEIDASLLSEAMLDFMRQVPPDLFNLEIGVQSTFKPALEAVRRNFDWEKLSGNIKRLKSFRNFHLHLDLIAGLPGEGYEDFTQSFNMVYALEPDVLQLGFLKLLKGSDLRKESDRYDYVFQFNPPYQVLSTNCMKYEEILSLSFIEDILGKYYNSGSMRKTVAYIVKEIYAGKAIGFYEDFVAYWQFNSLFGIGHKKEVLYQYLQEFIIKNYPSHSEISHELLKYDYLCFNHRHGLPEGLISNNPSNCNDIINKFTRDENFVIQYLSEMSMKSPREIRKYLRVEYFHVDPRTLVKVRTAIPIMFIYRPVTKVDAKVIYLAG
ncbi:MAG: B12-binding domain-containing radical SAM protein [Firmicutes bacterium HGW-Firmicutes-15]|nr:MAG: B12-binding domain-containing radical SAM protein [Firmicutes bacterium HGW-Firmicutes-15]